MNAHIITNRIRLLYGLLRPCPVQVNDLGIFHSALLFLYTNPDDKNCVWLHSLRQLTLSFFQYSIGKRISKCYNTGKIQKKIRSV